MTKFAYLIIFLGLAVSLVLAFFDALPPSPFQATVADFIGFLNSGAVAQGLAWLAWVFPVNNILALIPAFINALIAFFTLRGTLFILSLHV